MGKCFFIGFIVAMATRPGSALPDGLYLTDTSSRFGRRGAAADVIRVGRTTQSCYISLTKSNAMRKLI